MWGRIDKHARAGFFFGLPGPIPPFFADFLFAALFCLRPTRRGVHAAKGRRELSGYHAVSFPLRVRYYCRVFLFRFGYPPQGRSRLPEYAAVLLIPSSNPRSLLHHLPQHSPAIATRTSTIRLPGTGMQQYPMGTPFHGKSRQTMWNFRARGVEGCVLNRIEGCLSRCRKEEKGLSLIHI